MKICLSSIISALLVSGWWIIFTSTKSYPELCIFIALVDLIGSCLWGFVIVMNVYEDWNKV